MICYVWKRLKVWFDEKRDRSNNGEWWFFYLVTVFMILQLLLTLCSWFHEFDAILIKIHNIKHLDKVADYDCICEDNYGGKNCSVPLTGCMSTTCLNGGSCTPWLVGETDHRANCSCTAGFSGELCQIQTTFSFPGNSYITVQTERQEGFELQFRQVPDIHFIILTTFHSL